MTKQVKENVRKFVKDNNLNRNKISYENLMNSAESMGYTVIEFDKLYNDENVKTIIKNLNLEAIVMCSNGFTYTNENYRLIFINEKLNEKEKILVLAHELGHISFQHCEHKSVIGNDVTEEFMANEFAHYLLVPDFFDPVRKFYNAYKKQIIIASVAIIACAGISLGGYYVYKESTYYGEYYVTKSGSKYHKKGCSVLKSHDSRRMTKKDFESKKYGPCKFCLPE